MNHDDLRPTLTYQKIRPAIFGWSAFKGKFYFELDNDAYLSRFQMRVFGKLSERFQFFWSLIFVSLIMKKHS